MDKLEDKSVESLLKTQKNLTWYQVWSDFFVKTLLKDQQKNESIISLINQLCESLGEGDSCIVVDDFTIANHEIVANIQQLDSVSDLALERSYKPLIWDAPYLYLQRYWALENKLAQSIITLAKRKIALINAPELEYLLNDPDQKAALNLGVNSPFAIITGGPGTGKTYILTRIVAVLKKYNNDLKIAMAAPTGKAAQRMQESLQKAFSDRQLLDAGLYHSDFEYQETLTIHRLLGMGHQQVPKYHQHNPLPYDVIVIDEASMLDLQLAQVLCAAVKPSARLILLGDANQLSSVDVGQVLADLQRVDVLQKCHVKLKLSQRFSDDANIGRFAKFIYQYEAATLNDWLEQCKPNEIKLNQLHFDIQNTLVLDWVGFYQLSEEGFDQELTPLYIYLSQGFDAYVDALKKYNVNKIDKKQLAQIFDQYRILTAMRYGDLGVDQVNAAVTQYICAQLNQTHYDEWYLGRPVMMQYNDYQLGLSNGDIGICLFDHKHPDQYVVYFPSLNINISVARLPQFMQTAFAMTIHKSQGSEFMHTAVILDEQATSLLSKELLYTAITRAKKMVSLYSSQNALETSLSVMTQRKSGLSNQIQRAAEIGIK